MGSGEWELYNLENDPAETTDLSDQYPEIKKQLIDAWNEYARKNELHDHQAHYDSFYRKSFAPEKD
jgi:arylsulfatase